MSAPTQARHLRLLEALPEPPDGGGRGGKTPAATVRASRMNLVEVGIQLARSVAVLDDDEARIMRDTARAAGANAQLLAAALRLRDQRQREDVVHLHVVEAGLR